MSEVWSRVVVGGLSGSLMRSSSRLAATRPISRQGWATTVSRGSKLSAQSKSSKSDKRDVARRRDPTATQAPHHPNGRKVVARENGRRRVRDPHQTFGQVRGGVDVDRAGRDQIILGVDAVPGDRRTVARNAFKGCGEARLARHHSDPPMPKPTRWSTSRSTKSALYTPTLIEFLGYKTIDEHGRYLVFPDIADGAFVRRGRRREDDAVDAVLMQCLHEPATPAPECRGCRQGRLSCRALRIRNSTARIMSLK